MTPSSPLPPPAVVLRAFGVASRDVSGLSDRAWRAGAVVLKPAHAPDPWLEWEERFCSRVVDSGFRLQRLRRSDDGRIVVDGWIARDYLPGEHPIGSWQARMGAGLALLRAFGEATPLAPALPTLPRADAWATADRMAWEELPIPPAAMADPVVAELAGARRPVHEPPQVVHGDLTGNILFHRELPPAVIDMSPYYRPVGFATGVIAADAVIWHGADLGLARRVIELPEGRACLIRAMLFRHLTSLLLPGPLPTAAAAVRYAALRRLILEASAL
jgi:uncharacterized protein (TIGR02569 family)